MALVAFAVIYALSSRNQKSPPLNGDRPAKAAYDAYMRGRVKVSIENSDNNEAAIKLFEQAVAADPSFAAAFAELARAYSIQGTLFRAGVREEQV